MHLNSLNTSITWLTKLVSFSRPIFMQLRVVLSGNCLVIGYPGYPLMHTKLKATRGKVAKTVEQSLTSIVCVFAWQIDTGTPFERSWVKGNSYPIECYLSQTYFICRSYLSRPNIIKFFCSRFLSVTWSIGPNRFASVLSGTQLVSAMHAPAQSWAWLVMSLVLVTDTQKTYCSTLPMAVLYMWTFLVSSITA